MRIGTRGSQLALWQARTVARLIAECGGPPAEIVVIRTSGDESAATIAGRSPAIKRLFVKELEEALADGRIDAAVHSSKDMPADLPPGLTIGAALPRADARDAVVLPASRTCAGDAHALRDALGPSPRLGTASPRRATQLRTLLPDARVVTVRGNVDTRLRKLDAGECDALVLAAAGLRRLRLDHRIACTLPVDLCVPAPGQGIIAVEIRDDDKATADALADLNDADAADALTAERALVQALGGGCRLPIGAFATIDGQDLDLTAVVISPDGRHVVRQRLRGRRSDAASIGERLGTALLDAGARAILDTARARGGM